MAEMGNTIEALFGKNAELESANARLFVENKRLEEQVEKLQYNLANTVHQLTQAERAVFSQSAECGKGVA